MNQALHRRLHRLGVEHRWDVGKGPHLVQLMTEALARSLPMMMKTLQP
jgi:hypothetical protein